SSLAAKGALSTTRQTSQPPQTRVIVPASCLPDATKFSAVPYSLESLNTAALLNCRQNETQRPRRRCADAITRLPEHSYGVMTRFCRLRRLNWHAHSRSS